jgi:hypothetical protein
MIFIGYGPRRYDFFNFDIRSENIIKYPKTILITDIFV